MSDLTSIVQVLFTAPVEAALLSEREIRRVWAEWLRNIASLASSAGLSGEALVGFINTQLALAPVMKFDAEIDLGMTLKITSLNSREGGGKIGLSVGPFSAAGQFSFMQQNSSESVLNARAVYSLSNANAQTLSGYLNAARLECVDVDSLRESASALEAVEGDT